MVLLINSMQAMREGKNTYIYKYYHALAVVFILENALFTAVFRLPKLIPWKNNSLLN